MAEQPLSSDRETALAPSAPAQRAPPEMPRARRLPLRPRMPRPPISRAARTSRSAGRWKRSARGIGRVMGRSCGGSRTCCGSCRLQWGEETVAALRSG